MPQSSWLWRSRRTRTIAALACVLASWTCDHEAAGPGRHASLAVAALLPATDLAAFNLTIDNVRLIVVRPPADTVLDQTFNFPANQSSLPIAADVPLEQPSETFHVTIQLLSGSTLLFEGTQDVTLESDVSLPAAQIPVVYGGPGQNVASLSIDPVDSLLTQGATLRFRLTARDAQNVIVPTFYASWTTSDTTIAKVDATGLLTAPFTRGTVDVLARTPSNVSASTPITFVPVADAINIVSGCGQSGAPGAQLSQPIVARVVAGDGFGVKGIPVQFTAPAGGSVATPTVVTDANGLAQTLATLPLARAGRVHDRRRGAHVGAMQPDGARRHAAGVHDPAADDRHGGEFVQRRGHRPRRDRDSCGVVHGQREPQRGREPRRQHVQHHHRGGGSRRGDVLGGEFRQDGRRLHAGGVEQRAHARDEHALQRDPRSTGAARVHGATVGRGAAGRDRAGRRRRGAGRVRQPRPDRDEQCHGGTREQPGRRHIGRRQDGKCRRRRRDVHGSHARQAGRRVHPDGGVAQD